MGQKETHENQETHENLQDSVSGDNHTTEQHWRNFEKIVTGQKKIVVVQYKR